MPYTPRGTGYRKTDTSAQAAMSLDAAQRGKTLREKVLALLADTTVGLSADQIADKLKEDHGAIRPRLTELRGMGLVADSGRRGKTKFGKSCILWAAVRAEAA